MNWCFAELKNDSRKYWKEYRNLHKLHTCMGRHIKFPVTESSNQSLGFVKILLHRFFFYKNSFYKNHQAQNCQKIKNILRIMARLKYMIKNLESPLQNAFTIPWDFLFYILCNLGKFKRNYEYNLSLIYKVPI